MLRPDGCTTTPTTATANTTATCKGERLHTGSRTWHSRKGACTACAGPPARPQIHWSHLVHGNDVTQAHTQVLADDLVHPDLALICCVISKNDAHSVLALLTLRSAAVVKYVGARLRGTVLAAPAAVPSVRARLGVCARLEHHGVAAEQLELIHGRGVQRHHRVVIITDRFVHYEAVGRLLALQNGGGVLVRVLQLAATGRWTTVESV